MRNLNFFVFIVSFLLLRGINTFASSIPYMEQMDDFNGELIVDLNAFMPNTGDFTLEMKGSEGVTIEIHTAKLSYTPTANSIVRFVQKDGKVYVFEDRLLKNILTPEYNYETTGDNLLNNPSFEEVDEQLSSGRWKPTSWETWDGGKPTWGSEVGKTNIREDATYRSDGAKSIIMHSETRQLLQQLPQNALTPNKYYLLTYDYWTSAGNNNGGITYNIYLKREMHTGNLQTIPGHTTAVSGTAKNSYSTLFKTNESLPEMVWFVMERTESKVDWLDNLKLYQVISSESGIEGASDVKYISGTSYAPVNLKLEGDNYIDMTPRIANSGFDSGTSGWEIQAPGSKISTAEKANGLIPGNQNHLQFWVGSGGINGSLSQTITNLPNGKYIVKAAISSSFSGNVSLFSNSGKTEVQSGDHKIYEATGIVFDNTLKIGLEINTSGSPTIDIDDFKLHFVGEDAESYLTILETVIDIAVSDTVIMLTDQHRPGYYNLEEYRNAINQAKYRPNNDPDTLLEEINRLQNAIDNYKEILDKYGALKEAYITLQTQLASSAYPNKNEFNTAIQTAKDLYESSKNNLYLVEDKTEEIKQIIHILDAYHQLQRAIIDAKRMAVEYSFPGKDTFNASINSAQHIYDNPDGVNLIATIETLYEARLIYYESQFVIIPEKKVISWVDTSLNGSEKFVLRIDGKPFYMTNIQLRLDKLYGYHGWNDKELEAVVKRAADDGFNTVSINVHWREIEPEKDKFDWTILDKYMSWCKKYDIKMEVLWFSWSSGGRVQYLWNYQGRQEPRTPDYVCSLDGQSEYNMLRKEWEYSLDWRDTNLREREKFVVRKMMDHIAKWDVNNGSPMTVIGVQLGNEARSHGGNSASDAEIVEYYHHVGAGVKESDYSTWTRLNCVSWETPGRIRANEAKRNSGGTNIDFVGIDIYGTNAGSILGNMNGQMPHTGKNFSMIMEIDAKDANSPIYQIAALAGNKSYIYYNMGFVDGNGLYSNSGNTLVERDHINLVRQRNEILNLANQDIALKNHGASLYVHNYAGNSTNATTNPEGISFTPDNAKTQAISIRKSATQIVLLSTANGVFNFPASWEIVSASKGYYDSSNKWIHDEDVNFTKRSVLMPTTSAVLVRYKTDGENDSYILNPSFELGTTSVNGHNVPVSWNLVSDLGGYTDVKLSTESPAHGNNKCNIWAGQVRNINLYQDIVLPKGDYTLTASMRTGGAGDISDQHIYVKTDTDNILKSKTLIFTENPYWQQLSVDFVVDKDNSDVRIGAASTGSGTTAGWFQIDNFELKVNDQTPTPIVKQNEVLSIIPYKSGVFVSNINNTESNTLTIYSVTGHLIKKSPILPAEKLLVPLNKGFYIINGSKIVVP